MKNTGKLKNLLVIGECGFIGSNFINYIFSKNKYNIINFFITITININI